MVDDVKSIEWFNCWIAWLFVTPRRNGSEWDKGSPTDQRSIRSQVRTLCTLKRATWCYWTVKTLYTHCAKATQHLLYNMSAGVVNVIVVRLMVRFFGLLTPVVLSPLSRCFLLVVVFFPLSAVAVWLSTPWSLYFPYVFILFTLQLQ